MALWPGTGLVALGLVYHRTKPKKLNLGSGEGPEHLSDHLCNILCALLTPADGPDEFHLVVTYGRRFDFELLKDYIPSTP